MKIEVICVGKIAYAPIKEAIERYAGRLEHYVPFHVQEIPDVKNTKSLTEAQQKTAEGALLLNALQSGDYVVLLDERGKEYTSREFAKYISDKMVSLPGRLVMVIGGPYGFSEAVYARADAKLSLSKMTFPHEMCRLFLIEQLYRALSILNNLPYHHE